MTITRARSRKITFDYRMNDSLINRVEKFNDLGVIFNHRLDFNDDISFRTSKARAISGLIRRHSADFNNDRALLTLFTALARSRLEYCSQVWSPYYNGTFNSIEHIQERFLKFLNRDSGITRYEDLCKKFKMDTLSLRRKMASVMFVFDLLTNKIDSPDLLSRININCPVRYLREMEFLRPERHATNYAKFEPMNVSSMLFNIVKDVFDFNVSRDTFKNQSLEKFRNFEF